MTTFFESPDVKVDETTITIRGAEYRVDEVGSVSVDRRRSLSVLPVAAMVIGFVIGPTGALMANNPGEGPLRSTTTALIIAAAGLVLALTGFIVHRIKNLSPTFDLVFETDFGSKTVYSSQDPDHLAEINAAIFQARRASVPTATSEQPRDPESR
jgi:hypothetical protein